MQRDMELIQAIVSKSIASVEVDFPGLRKELPWIVGMVAHVHSQTPLRLEDMLADETGSREHDVFGIRRFFSPSQMALTDCFLPRFTG